MSEPKDMISGSVTAKDLFFDDGVRQIDYILVYNKNKPSVKRDVYLDGLQMSGLQLESVRGLAELHIVFVKVHAPKEVLKSYANLYDIPVKKEQFIFLQPPRPSFKCMRTELTSQDPTTPNYKRAKETFAYEQPIKLLSYERSMIVYNIMKRTDFGVRDYELGIDRLLRQEVFLSAFSLHDGQSKWNDNLNEPLNDRQLLRRYWSSIRVLFKKQPLDVVERYFGVTIAMYFSFSSFYNKMLIFPTILGLAVIVINISTYKSKLLSQVCASGLIICPTCPSCKARTLSDYCGTIKIHVISDSIYTIIYSIAITFWAAVFLALWKRRQAVLGLRWNITDSKFEEQDIRPEFENIAKMRITEFDEAEMYIPWYLTVWRYILAYIFVLLACISVIAILASIVVLDIILSRKLDYGLISAIISELLTVVAILAMRRGYNYLIEWVVNLEVPKTQTDFYNSYILKVFLFSSVNNYGTLIYLAYFKRFIYTHPGDPKMYSETTYYLVNTCGPLGCYAQVNILLGVIMLLLPNLNELVNVCKLKYRIWREGDKLKKAHLRHHDMPQWEKDYELFHMNPIEQITQYEQIVIQFGYVTLFSVAFPIAPFLALMSNLFKTHREADYFITKCRRPLAGRTENIGTWLNVMQFIMFASIVTNGFFVGFTTHTIERYLYNQFQPESFHSMVGFIKTIFLSSYHLNKDHYPGTNIPNGTKCWYPKYDNDAVVYLYKDEEGWKYHDYDEEEMKFQKIYKHNVTQKVMGYVNTTFPPKNAQEIYIKNTDLLNLRLHSVLWYENVVMLITVLINYAIPDTPSSVTQKYADFTMNSRKDSRPSSIVNYPQNSL